MSGGDRSGVRSPGLVFRSRGRHMGACVFTDGFPLRRSAAGTALFHLHLAVYVLAAQARSSLGVCVDVLGVFLRGGDEGTVVGASVDDSGVVVYVRRAQVNVTLGFVDSLGQLKNVKVKIEFETRPSIPACLCSTAVCVWGKGQYCARRRPEPWFLQDRTAIRPQWLQGPPPSCSTFATMALSDDVWRCRQHAHLGGRLPLDPWERNLHGTLCSNRLARSVAYRSM